MITLRHVHSGRFVSVSRAADDVRRAQNSLFRFSVRLFNRIAYGTEFVLLVRAMMESSDAAGQSTQSAAPLEKYIHTYTYVRTYTAKSKNEKRIYGAQKKQH